MLRHTSPDYKKLINLTCNYFYNRVRLGSINPMQETVDWLNKKGPEDPEYPFQKDVKKAYIDSDGHLRFDGYDGGGATVGLPKNITEEHNKTIIDDKSRTKK